tara:strand:+ start:315 stop:767 length:453 start_codon:yes stop_codon:yes gene_type:complete
MEIEEILRRRKIPNEIQNLIIEYTKPKIMDEKIQEQIKCESVYQLFKRTYAIFEEDLEIYNEELEEDGTIEPPYLPMMFEYLVDCLPHEEFKHYMKCLENCKTFNSDIATIDYFITALKLVRNWEMHNNFYDDDEYYLNYSRYYDDASDL